eukprot:RCo038601
MEIPLAPQGGTRPGDWVCPLCMNNNFAYRLVCNRCGGSRSTPPASSSTSQTPKPGDWYCSNPACGNLNFAKRYICNRCGAQQPGYAAGFSAAVAEAMASGGGALGGGMTTALRASPRPGQKTGPPVLPGDWTCARCLNINFAKRTQCNQCAAPKVGNVLEEHTGPSPGLASSALASQLTSSTPNPALSRPGGAGGTKMLAGDWICPACENLNFARRISCNRCQTPKPSNPTDVFALQAQAQMSVVAPF